MLPTATEDLPNQRRAISLLPLLRPLLLLIAIVLAATSSAQAQQGGRLVAGDTLWEVHLAAGESYVGRVVAASADSVTLETVTGTRIGFARTQAVRVRPARGVVRGGRFWPEDPNDTRLFFSPTARNLEQGDGYFGVYELFIPFVAYGITDRLSIAGGSPFYLALTGEITPPFYFGPKLLVVESESFSLSAGAMGVVVTDDDDTETFGILYGAGTWGSPDQALSFGAGWGALRGEISDKPVVMVGGETRLGRYTKLLTENLFVPGEDGVIASAGLRLFGSRLSADAGLAGWIGDGGECCFPLVNVVYNFGPGR